MNWGIPLIEPRQEAHHFDLVAPPEGISRVPRLMASCRYRGKYGTEPQLQLNCKRMQANPSLAGHMIGAPRDPASGVVPLFFAVIDTGRQDPRDT